MLQTQRVYRVRVSIDELRDVILTDLFPDFDQDWARSSKLHLSISPLETAVLITFTEKEASDAQAQAG